MADEDRGQPRVSLVIRYGSTVSGRARPDSDVDIAVLAERELSLAERGRVLVDIARSHGIPEDRIDLVDLRTDNPLLLHEVAEKGVLLQGDPDDFLRFRVQAWKIHQDTARLRRARSRHLKDVLDVP